MASVLYGMRELEKNPDLKPKVISVDAEVVRLVFPNAKKYISIEFNFPSLEQKDAFLESERTEIDFHRNEGQTIFRNSNESFLVDENHIEEEDRNDADPENTRVSERAKHYGVTSTGVFLARSYAMTAWLASQNRKKAA